MARHRAPDVALPLHGPSPTAGHTGTGRPRHAAGPSRAAQAPVQVRTGRHRAAPSLEFIGPIVVVDPDRPPVVVALHAAPVVVSPVVVSPVVVAPIAEPDPVPEPAPESSVVAAATPASTGRRPLAELVSWAGFASLVSCAVVGAGQGEREQAIWTLGVSGAVLSSVGMGLLAAGRRRPELPR